MRTFLSTTAGIAALLISGAALADNNEVYIEQYGDENVSVADQTGTGNLADYFVDGNGNEIGTGGGNKPDTKGSLQEGTDLDLFVTQIGNGNKAGGWEIDQRGSTNEMDFNQEGNNNDIRLAQQRFSDNFMDIDQVGNGNRVNSAHQGGGTLNNMTIAQSGNNNGTSDVLDIIPSAFDGTVSYGTLENVEGSSSNAAQVGTDNILTIIQTGDGNGFDVAQGCYGDDPCGNDSSISSEFYLDQVGTYNYTYGRQTGMDQYADVLQSGYANVAVVSQKAN